ncbi:MAG: DNA primase [Oscillospiraceae bacterium]|jgi:DNA primase|nr:DNA primase [Oscillospiraceae bacterium]
MIPEDFIEHLKLSLNIEEVVSPYCALIRRGRDYVCLCPFHSEKTASCHIYTESQSFHCFGCGAGGSAFTFIQLIENIEFPEAVRFLAQKAGLDVPEAGAGNRESGRKNRLLEINKKAARFYCALLHSPEGTTGLDYLYSRGLTPNTIRKYGLGYAPPGWSALKEHMRAENYSEDELIEASLLSRGNKGNTYDFFRYRIMFPVIDRRGNVIGFGSRTLDPDDKQFKYMNSKETAVFKKSASLFSINFAKNAADKKTMFLCEGNMDVIILNQAGFENAAATCGTAITAEQARLLRGYCEQVIIATDSDLAGQKAAEKAVNLLGQAGLSARVLELPADTKDPDDYIRKYGAEAFRALAEGSRSVISFELKKASAGLETETPEGRAEYLKRAIAILAGIDSPAERAVYTSETARMCQIPVGTLEENVNSRRKSNVRRGDYEDKRKLIRGESGQKRRDEINPDEAKFPLQAKAERGIITYLFHSPDKLAHIVSKVAPTDFPTAFNAKLLEILVLRLAKGLSLDRTVLGSEFSAQEMGRIEAIIRENSELPFTMERLSEYIKILEDFRATKNKKSPADMTAEELLEYSRMLKKT